MENSSHIAIIGGGISGIAAAKQLRKHNLVVFEATDCIGGVWKHCVFRTTKLQTPRCYYEFSDFPWAERDNSSFPSNIEILEYVHQYAMHFDVLKFVEFNSKVVKIRLIGDRQKSDEYGSLLSGQPVWKSESKQGDRRQFRLVNFLGGFFLLRFIGISWVLL